MGYNIYSKVLLTLIGAVVGRPRRERAICLLRLLLLLLQWRVGGFAGTSRIECSRSKLRCGTQRVSGQQSTAAAVERRRLWQQHDSTRALRSSRVHLPLRLLDQELGLCAFFVCVCASAVHTWFTRISQTQNGKESILFPFLLITSFKIVLCV